MSLEKLNCADFLVEVKTQIKSSQAKAALSVNASLIAMNWNIGALIAKNQALFVGKIIFKNYVAKFSSR